MSTVSTVLVTADVPGGPFELEVPVSSSAPDTFGVAKRRALWSLMASGKYDPPEDVGPDQALENFTAELIDPKPSFDHGPKPMDRNGYPFIDLRGPRIP